MAHIMLPKHPMPTIPLTQSELADLAVYILSMRKSGITRTHEARTRFGTSSPMAAGRGSSSATKRAPIGRWSSFDSADRHERSHDLGRDRPARVKESANAARHAVEPRRDLHEAAKEDFVALVAAEIEARAWPRSIRSSGAGRAARRAHRAQAEAVQADGQDRRQRSAEGSDQGARSRLDRAPRARAEVTSTLPITRHGRACPGLHAEGIRSWRPGPRPGTTSSFDCGLDRPTARVPRRGAPCL